MSLALDFELFYFILVAGALEIWWWEMYSRRGCSRKRPQ